MVELERTTSVEVTSEDNSFPIEYALSQEATKGWRAAEAGVQTIRLIVDRPQRLKRISLVFLETEDSRTQEFILSWSSDRGNSCSKIVLYEWNLSWLYGTR